MSFFPTQLAIEDEKLIVQWDDGLSQAIPVSNLRKRCPCAHCREERTKDEPEVANSLKILSPAQTQPVSISKMEPVGNYAYSIRFSDGHSSGIFPFEFLRSIDD